MKIRKGDTVYIRTGEDRGKTGKVLFVNLKKKTVVVEGVNMRKRAQRPTQKNPKGGVITIEAPVHVSNVGIYSTVTSGPTKTGTRIIDEGGKKKRVRISRDSGEEI
jgi:large subunit ribosomal protein L24